MQASVDDNITAAAMEAESRVLMSSCSNLTLRTITDLLLL